MQPEDKLDILLSLRVENGRRTSQPPTNELNELDELTMLNGHDGLQPLLDAADRLTELGSAEPSVDFTARLEAQLFAQADYERERAAEPVALGNDATTLSASDPAALPTGDLPPSLGSDTPTLPGIEWPILPEEATEADIMPFQRPVSAPRRRARRTRLLWPVLAATLLLAIGSTIFSAAASAGPGTLLYGLHRWEQNVQVSMASSASDRTRLHLGYAQDALTALNAAVARHEAEAVYDDALATFRDEMSAAAANLAGVSGGSERDTLSAQLGQLQTQGRADLRVALASLPWPERVATTSALGEIGGDVLHVTQASLVNPGHGQHLWQITVSGSGFQQGAVLLVNGQPAGTVISVTPTTLVAQLAGDDSAPLPSSIGVANPDNTAALTSNLSSHEQEDVTPSPQQTPGGDDHGGGGHGGSGGGGGNSSSDDGGSGHSG